jgi:hypothetical protein
MIPQVWRVQRTSSYLHCLASSSGQNRHLSKKYRRRRITIGAIIGGLICERRVSEVKYDREVARHQLFDRAGKFKRQWTGAKDAQTTGRVFCVDADSDGFLYLGIRRADYDTPHTGVLKLDRNWNIVASIGFGKPGDPVFNAVHDIAVGRDGSIYVAETRTKRVVKLRPVRP